MQYSRTLLLLITALNLTAEAVQAADENPFLEELRPQLEQTIGQGQTALWTLPLVATQYQPLHPTPTMRKAIQAQEEGHFLKALILLDEAGKSGPASSDAMAELNLLRASFLLQGNQNHQALEILSPLLAKAQYAADAYALTSMAYLEQGRMQEALKAAQQAHNSRDGMLSHLAQSYALQGTGRLKEAREVVHAFNARMPQAVTLAREAELALTLGQIQSARALVNQAQEAEAAHPYIIAVSGFAYLINGHVTEAKAAFETALRRNPKDAKALLGLGLSEIKLGNFAEGHSKLQAADEAEPGNALILTYLGRAQQQAGQAEAAIASWRSARQADPKDPTPWLYQAQAELQANHFSEARESLRQAQARSTYRAVYRGANLLREDEQLLQANLAEIQHRLGMETLAFHTLSDPVSEKSSASLRNQADVLQGQRFGESARRSLLLQSQFDARPGNLPAALDIFGDGAGQTGAATPQHGAVSGISAQQASYNNYEELFSRRTTLEVDATTGNQNSSGEQIRLGVGNDTLGLGIAQREFKTDGNARFENLDNRIAQAIVQWRPGKATQAFVSYQTFHSKHGETFYPADPMNLGTYNLIEDNSRVKRLGLRHTLTDDSELRGLWSQQQTGQTTDSEWMSNVLPFSDLPPWFGPALPFPQFSSYGNSSAHSAELQYRRSGAEHAMQWGAQQMRGQLVIRDALGNITASNLKMTQQFYAAWQQMLNPHWQLDAGLGWGKIDDQNNLIMSNSTYLQRWLPKLGMVYTPDAGTHVRVAGWRGMGVSGVGDATLAPVSLAGILQNRPGDNDKLVRGIALSADKQLSPVWLLTAETQQRKTFLPGISLGQQVLFEQQVDESGLALHWQAEGHPFAVSLIYDDERIQNDPSRAELDSVQEQHLRSQQLALRWLPGAQWTANLAWSHNRVTGTQRTSQDPAAWDFTTVFSAYQNSFNQVDTDLNWQFNRRGTLSAGVRNAADQRFQYMDIDRLSPRFSNGRLVYAKLKMAW